MVTHKIVLINEYRARGLAKGKSQFNELDRSMMGVDKRSGDLLTSFTKFRWLLVNVAMAAGVVVGAFRGMQLSAGKLESSLLSLEIISQKSGISFDEIRSIIFKLKEGFVGLVSEASLVQAAMLFMKTELPIEKFEAWTKAVADGSAAMGEDFNIQLALVTKGLIRLEPRVLDNIGAEMKLNLLYKEGAAALGKNQATLTVVERRQLMFNKVIEETSKFQGSFIIQQDTLNGQLAQLKVAFEELGVAIGEAGLLGQFKGLAESTTEFVRSFNEIDKDTLSALIKLGESALFVGLARFFSLRIWAMLPAMAIGLAAIGAVIAGFPVIAASIAALGAIAIMPETWKEKLGLADFDILQAVFPSDREIIQKTKEFTDTINEQLLSGLKGITAWRDFVYGAPARIPEMAALTDEYQRQAELLDRELQITKTQDKLRRNLLKLEFERKDLINEIGKAYERIMKLEEATASEKRFLIKLEKGILDEKIKQARYTWQVNYRTEILKNLNKDLDKQYKDIGDQIDANTESQRRHNEEVQKILDKRFKIRGISETDIGHLIRQQQIELTKAQFATMGLGTAEEFLRGASLLTADAIDSQTDSVRRLIAATETGQDRFEAWQTALRETIRSLLISSQDIDRDVTEVIRKAQTELLSITRFDREKGDQFSAMETNLDALGMAQDIFFGSEAEKLQYSEELREDRINGMNESAEQAIANLELERTTLEALINQEQSWISQQKRIRDEIDKNKDKIDGLAEALRDLDYDKLRRMIGELKPREPSQPSGGRGGGGTPKPSEPTTREEFMAYLFAKQAALQDFVSRPGQPIQAFNPQDTIIGVKNPEAVAGATNNVQIIIQGYNRNPQELAIEVKRQLSALA